MSFDFYILRWLPLVVLVLMALAFEPIRSGFTLDDQACEIMASWKRVQAAAFNLRHILSYGVLFIVAAATLRQNRIARAAIGVFLFSALLEFEQSYFVTGHCRMRDLIPNLIGIGIFATIFFYAGRWLPLSNRLNSKEN